MRFFLGLIAEWVVTGVRIISDAVFATKNIGGENMLMTDNQKKKWLNSHGILDENDSVDQLIVQRDSSTFEIEEYSLSLEDKEMMEKFQLIQTPVTQSLSKFKLCSSSYKEVGKLEYVNEENTIENTNKYVIDFISDSRIFIDHLESWVKKNVPTYYREWKAEQSKIYDEKIAYRLCYQLRNFSQHVNLPIGVVSSRLEKLEDGSREFKNVCLLDGQAIIRDSQFMNKLNINKNFFDSEKNCSFLQYAEEYFKDLFLLYLHALVVFMNDKISDIEEVKAYLLRAGFRGPLYKTTLSKKEIIDNDQMELSPIVSVSMIDDFMRKMGKMGVINIV